MFFCAGCFIAASPEEDKDRDGEGGVCRVSGMRCMQAGHASVPPMSRCQCSHVFCLFFFFFFKASYHPALTSFTPPLQNKTPPAWPMKKTLVTKRHDTLLWPVTLFQYWVNCSYYSLLYSSLPHISIINYVSFPCSVCVKHVQLSC